MTNFDSIGTQVGSSYVSTVHLPFPHCRMFPFLSSFGKNTLKFVFFPFTALSSCMAALVVNSNKN